MKTIEQTFKILFTMSFLVNMQVLTAQILLYEQYFEPPTTIPLLPAGWFSSNFNPSDTTKIRTASDVKSNQPGSQCSCTGGNNLLARNCAPSEPRHYGVGGITSLGRAGIYLSFGHRRTYCFTPIVLLEWSHDGINWTLINEFSSYSAGTEWSLAGPYYLSSEADNRNILLFRWSFFTSNGSPGICNNFNNCNGFSGNYRIDDFKVFASTILPIELISFTAKQKEEYIDLTWQTASEQNNSYFSIEKSTDGSNFLEIGQEEGQGTTLETTDYQFTDFAPLTGVSYYRLRQVDFDGNFSFSNIESVDFKGKGKTAIYPTPTTGRLNIHPQENFGPESDLMMFDKLGRLVRVLLIDEDAEFLELDVTDLPVGTYFMKLRQGRSFETLRFTKI